MNRWLSSNLLAVVLNNLSSAAMCSGEEDAHVTLVYERGDVAASMMRRMLI
jgi:hypothetical protein